MRWRTGRNSDEGGTHDSVSARQPAHDPEITQNEQIVGTFVEIIGNVVEDSRVKLLAGLNLDSDKELGKLYHSCVSLRL